MFDGPKSIPLFHLLNEPFWLITTTELWSDLEKVNLLISSNSRHISGYRYILEIRCLNITVLHHFNEFTTKIRLSSVQNLETIRIEIQYCFFNLCFRVDEKLEKFSASAIDLLPPPQTPRISQSRQYDSVTPGKLGESFRLAGNGNVFLLICV